MESTKAHSDRGVSNPSPKIDREYNSAKEISVSFSQDTNQSKEAFRVTSKLSISSSVKSTNSRPALRFNLTRTAPSRDVARRAQNTELHEACSRYDSIHEIRPILRSDPSAAAVQDREGSLPMHLLGKNTALFNECVRTQSSEEIDSFILDEMMLSCPDGPITSNNEGCIPFTSIICDWVWKSHQCERVGGLECLMETTPPLVKLTAHVEWSFHILSHIMVSYKRYASQIATKVAAIPCLVKTLLLIDDAEAREKIFKTQIMQCAVVCKEHVGFWLLPMLKNTSNPMAQKKAVEYLVMMSQVTGSTHFTPGTQTKSLRSLTSGAPIVHKKYEVYAQIERQQGLILSLLNLDCKTFEEAAQTDIIQWVLDQNVFSPFSLSIMFLDIISLILLLLVTSSATTLYFDGDQMVQEGSNCVCPTEYRTLFIVSFSLACLSALYFVTRHLSALRRMSFSAILMDFGVWGAVDKASFLLAVVLQIVYLSEVFQKKPMDQKCEMFMDESTSLREFAAVVFGLLLLKAVSFLKMMNHYLATFVFTLVEITKDIIWFVLVLFLFLIASANIFHTILYQPYADECNNLDNLDSNGQPINPFCRKFTGWSYLEVYTIIFGHFDMKDYYTTFSVIWFVIFSFLVVIISLNVLIAIVSDSHDKSMMMSAHLFGRARVLFVAELITFQENFKCCMMSENRSGGSGGKSQSSSRRTNARFLTCVRNCFRSITHLFFRIIMGASRGSGEKTADEKNSETMTTWNGKLLYWEKQVNEIVNNSECTVRACADETFEESLLEMRESAMRLRNKLGASEARIIERISRMEAHLLNIIKGGDVDRAAAVSPVLEHGGRKNWNS